MKLKIRVPAAVRHCGSGYLTMGLALGLYNEFYLEPAKSPELIGFPKPYADNRNLVVRAIEKTYQAHFHNPPAFRITCIQCIPIGMGLGSSASCILAGILGANYFLGELLKETEILTLAASMDGNPYQVSAAYYGSLVSSYIESNEVRAIRYPVSDSLLFTGCLPAFSVSVTPEEKNRTYPEEDVAYAISRAVNLPFAFQNGDIPLLYLLLDDRLHQPDLLLHLPESKLFQEFSTLNSLPFFVASDGPAYLYVSQTMLLPALRKMPVKNKWEFHVFTADKNGASTESVL